MINFNQLRIFYHAAKCLNFTRAAKELFITQPAVTAQVKLLEETLSLKLFKRRGRQVHLSDEGKTLYDYACRIFEYEKELEGVLEDMRKLKRGELRLGTTKTYARYFMPYLISSFRESYPHIRIHLDEGSSRDMGSSLLDFRNEVAIVAKIEEYPAVRFIPFSREEVVLIVSKENPLASRKSVGPRELAQAPIIMKETGSGTRKLVNELFADFDLTPNMLMETSNTEFIKQLVQEGMGVSFLVRGAVALEIREGKLASVPIRGRTLSLDVNIAYLEDQHLSPPARAFLDLLTELASGEIPPKGMGRLMERILALYRQEVP